ncbi:uncharacterized protein LOC126457458 isoform X1 [Schistocerca serialis cubense]|uniref:uncharacterized protein LOC126457458 isoform X1 n=2 Tax=Schistocerca TaxID=7008 RepID=UPI00214E50DC|nr:uncharacterized protein LOC126457458 isoform X1 [Schistocerca serialis cubense]
MTQWQLIRTRTEDAVVGQRRKRKPRDRGVGMRVGLADKCVRSVCSSAQHSTAETSQPAMDVKAAARTPAQAPSRSSYSMDPKVSFWRTAEGGRASICGSSSSSAYVYVDLPPATGAGDEDLKGAAPPVLSLSFAAKLFELVLTLVAEGLYAAGDALITDNFRTFIFPHVVYNTFIIVSGIVVTSYLLRIKMQELLVLSMVCQALAVHTLPGNMSTGVLQHITYGGYIIIVTVTLIGLSTNERIPRKIDMVYSLTGATLQMAAGSNLIDKVRRIHSWPPLYYNGRACGLACGSLAIINSAFFLIDFIIPFFDLDDDEDDYYY